MSKDLKVVGIKELKNSLSAFLKQITAGTTLLVSDRNKIVAQISLPQISLEFSNQGQAHLQELLDQGSLSTPAKSKSKLSPSGLGLADGTAQKLLEEDRGE